MFPRCPSLSNILWRPRWRPTGNGAVGGTPLKKIIFEVRGGPHEVFRPREGGADQDQVFQCRRRVVVSCRRRRTQQKKKSWGNRHT